MVHHEKQIGQLTAINTDLLRRIENSSLVPNGCVNVEFQEGKSLFRLGSGYVMRVEVLNDHRAVAEEALGRNLNQNEIIHHIYGPRKDDSSPGNLCVMDRDFHDLWHTFLEREFRLKGRYPVNSEQKSPYFPSRITSIKRGFFSY